MKARQWSEEQIINLLRQAHSGVTPIAELCRAHDISQTTFYKWRQKFGDLNVSEAKRLRALEQENARLKRLVAEQALDILALKEVLSKKW